MLRLFFEALNYFLMIVSVMIIASAILSWFPQRNLGHIQRVLHNLLEPILQPIRKMIQRSIFGNSHMYIDFSPFIAYLIITTLQRYIQVYMINL